jgi:hypothetical protein
LPLPLSPSMSTANGAAAARSTCFLSSAITGVTPNSSLVASLAACCRRAIVAATIGAAAAALIVSTDAAREVSSVVPSVQRAQRTPIGAPP